jgi:hypothetical protein
MFERSELSFIFLWVINPIVILFYQNCSSIPQQSTAINASNSQQIIQEYKDSKTSGLEIK